MNCKNWTQIKIINWKCNTATLGANTVTNSALSKMDKVIRKNNFYGNRKDTVLRYQKVYQQLTTDRDEVREEFTEFIKRLIDKGFKIIASIEHGDKTQNVRQTIDDNGQIAESKVD